jgi:regulator of RNase E activity RraB
VDHHSVDDYVLDLWQLAAACNGDYDGWETSVEKD